MNSDWLEARSAQKTAMRSRAREYVLRAIEWADRRTASFPEHPEHLDTDMNRRYSQVKHLTTTGEVAGYSLYSAVQYAVRAGIDGDIVECGVWRGGSAMLAAMALVDAGDTNRRIFLYDTFEGMPVPDSVDVDVRGRAALDTWTRKDESNEPWVYAPMEEVRRNMVSTGYPEDKVVLVQGRVEDTIPAIAPQAISVLRLDTDWYSSTYHEMYHLYPRLSIGGVLVLDDYGHWEGARKAVDQYLIEIHRPLLLNRINYSVRLGVKAFDVPET